MPDDYTPPQEKKTPDGFCDHGHKVVCSPEKHKLIMNGSSPRKLPNGDVVSETFEQSMLRAIKSTIPINGVIHCRCCQLPIAMYDNETYKRMLNDRKGIR